MSATENINHILPHSCCFYDTQNNKNQAFTFSKENTFLLKYPGNKNLTYQQQIHADLIK